METKEEIKDRLKTKYGIKLPFMWMNYKLLNETYGSISLYTASKIFAVWMVVVLFLLIYIAIR